MRRRSYRLLLDDVLAGGLRLDALAELAPQLLAHRRVEQAGHLVGGVAVDRLQLGIDSLVGLAHVRAAGVERATARQGYQRRRPAGDRHELLAARGVEPRDRGQQAPGVGVLWAGERG